MKRHLAFALDSVAFGVQLEQTGFDRFTVTYGKQVKTGLDYRAAAHELGLCIFHALACDGHISNLTQREAAKAGERFTSYPLEPWSPEAAPAAR